MDESSKKLFWEKKIVEWENGRYELEKKNKGILEFFADFLSSSLRFRLSVTPQLLSPYVPQKCILELGCGI